ncbi:MAG: 5-methyltetrahydropteroyltriglutamate--homocysteine S-methyltransferase, partial [Pseudomonadota bacterium]
MKYPYRADHVGSLLRPAAVKHARAAHASGDLDDGGLKAAEDGALAGLIAAQVEAGMTVVTDGEMRRSFWHYDFLGMLEGFDLVERSEGVQFAGIKLRPIFPTITGKLAFGDHPMIGHYEAVAAAAPEGVTPKISIPGPSCVHFRTAKDDIAPAEYQDPEALFADIVATYRDALKAFYAAGCRYLQ